MDERLHAAGRSVKSAFRALELLELLTTENRGLTFSDFQTALAYPKASLHGLLKTMSGARWITIDPVTRKYVLGVRVWEAGIAYTRMLPLDAMARPIMERVRNVTSEMVQLAVLEGFETLHVSSVDGRHQLRLDSSVGLRLEPHATGVGKVLLSGLPDERLRGWLNGRRLERYTPQTITTPAALLREIARVRKDGYALDREERTLGAICLAVGVRNHLGLVTAAMSVSAPAARFKQKEQAVALDQLRRAAAELSSALGYPGEGGRVGDPAAARVAPASRGTDGTRRAAAGKVRSSRSSRS